MDWLIIGAIALLAFGGFWNSRVLEERLRRLESGQPPDKKA